MMRRAALWLAALALATASAVAAIPEPTAVAQCPKVEYRIVVRRGVAVRDTLTPIPIGCQ